jgi:hypothetical protein
MSDEDDLRLNTLHRFAKHSPRLVLQEYSHCEVPAGCGGVIVRWYDPELGTPAHLRVTLRNATGDVWLDGAVVVSNRIQLVVGTHVVAMRLAATDPTATIAMSFGTMLDRDDNIDVATGRARWRIATEDPGAGWQRPDFDDAAWSARSAAGREALEAIPQDQRWAFDACLERGQSLYQFAAPVVWIRIGFEVTR